MKLDSSQQFYDEQYFAYQGPIGEFGGWANLTKFLPFIKKTDSVLDFGCGGGYLLKQLKNVRKAGIEVNPVARSVAHRLGISVYSSTQEVPGNDWDITISNHALEHCKRPLDEIIKLSYKLNRGGHLLFYVPAESVSRKYKANDCNGHLYTWSPLNLGNLFACAGLEIILCEAFHHFWPPFHRQIAKCSGRLGFEIASRIWGQVKRGRITQCRVLAKKRGT